jgi:hypothetical protein
MDLPPVGAVQQPGRTLRPVQRLGGDQPVRGELREQLADGLAMGAEHGVGQPPIPEQRQDLGRIGIDAEGSGGFDLQEAVTASGSTVC